MKLVATFTADAAVVMTTGETNTAISAAPGVAGVLQDVRLIASADTSVAVVIADATGNVFSIGSTDFTTAVAYKIDNAAILRNSVTGKLTATITGLGSGTFTVTAWVGPD